MDEHLLIAVATSSYPNLEPSAARPQLTAVLENVVNLFTKTIGGYRRELESISENPSSDSLRKGLDDWFSDPARDSSDRVVFYYTGHAQLVGSDSLYLLTTDFKPHRYVGTAFDFRQLADLLTANSEERKLRRVRNLLVIVDTCYAGKGVSDLAEKLKNALRQTSNNAFYVLGAALSGSEAEAGALAKALAESIEDLSKRYVSQKWLYLEQIFPAINQRLRVHAAVWSTVASTINEPGFFPNPSYIYTAGQPVLVADAVRLIEDQEYRNHWEPRARGVEVHSQPGSYFYGRYTVLEKLTAFLASTNDNRTRLVTGGPGAGKSAILAQLVTGDRKRKATDERPEPPRVDFTLHAKGMEVRDVKLRLAAWLGIEAKTEAILERFRESTSKFRLVVDALDEAVNATDVVEQLLAPLNAIDSVKLIVGTRNSLVQMFRGVDVIDIDTPEHSDERDLAEYASARLLRMSEPQQSTPYSGREEVAAKVALIVAKKAYPNFMVAKLIVEELLSRPRAANPESPKEMAFPKRLADAFDLYLARFGTLETAVRDLLIPLAYAEGKGLPWDNIWAPLASELSHRCYGDEDVRELLHRAGSFIMEDTEQGRSVYRLYHQALADVLRKGRRKRTTHAAFVKVLVSSVPLRDDNVGPDWFLANRYVRSHLTAHALASGTIARFVSDPLYLLAVDSNPLDV